jgi:hypothetical protein
MSLTLPPVGTSQLLELMSPYVPDDCLAGVCPRHFTGGRRHDLSAAQLWRVHLLALLTSTHSLNLLVAQLPEQATWRRFSRLRSTLPTARMLHEFRQAVGVAGLRAIDQWMRRIGRRRAVASKKNSGHYPAAHAALGGRTRKTGQSRWFVGYKKHTLRLWLPTVHPSVTLVPLVSWAMWRQAACCGRVCIGAVVPWGGGRGSSWRPWAICPQRTSRPSAPAGSVPWSPNCAPT